MTFVTGSTDDRPEWAVRLGLPRRETLTYAQALLLSGALAVVALYLTARTIHNPAVLLRAAHEKTGV